MLTSALIPLHVLCSSCAVTLSLATDALLHAGLVHAVCAGTVLACGGTSPQCSMTEVQDGQHFCECLLNSLALHLPVSIPRPSYVPCSACRDILPVRLRVPTRTHQGNTANLVNTLRLM
jgi:hypothetical protein